MNTKEVLKELKEDLLARGKTKETINSFLNISEKFLSTVKNDHPTIKHVNRYIAGLREDGYKDNYLRFNYYVISRLFKILGLEFKGEVPKISEEALTQTTFSFDEVKKLITNAKSFCDTQQKAFLCVSTIYGIRRSELVAIKPEDVKEDTILIRTRKGGMIREHTIPKEIKKYIHDYDWKERLSLSRASLMFSLILYLCKFKLKNGWGWHTVRRSLVSELMRKNIDHFAIQSFLRWKVSGISMLFRYTHIPMQDIEKVIFENHPFLKLW